MGDEFESYIFSMCIFISFDSRVFVAAHLKFFSQRIPLYLYFKYHLLKVISTLAQEMFFNVHIIQIVGTASYVSTGLISYDQNFVSFVQKRMMTSHYEE